MGHSSDETLGGEVRRSRGSASMAPRPHPNRAMLQLPGRAVCRRKAFRMSGTESADRAWVEAACCTWLHEALLFVSVLEAAGIRAAIPNEHFLGVVPLYAELVGGIRVVVPPDDLTRAREALSSATIALEPLDVSKPSI